MNKSNDLKVMLLKEAKKFAGVVAKALAEKGVGFVLSKVFGDDDSNEKNGDKKQGNKANNKKKK